MKIYFAGSIRGGRKDAKIYHQIIEHLKSHGAVLTEYIANIVSALGERTADNKIHDRDFNWLISSDMVIAEVSTPSLGVGYEIGRAVENRKKILCLYRPKKGKSLSPMISGSPTVVNKEYKTVKQAKKIIDTFLSKHRNTFKPDP